MLTDGGHDIVSGAGSGSMENSKRVCGPVCRGLRDVPTFPPIFGVHWQKRLLVTPEARRAICAYAAFTPGHFVGVGFVLEPSQGCFSLWKSHSLILTCLLNAKIVTYSSY